MVDVPGITITAQDGAARWLLVGDPAAIESSLGAGLPRTPNTTAAIAQGRVLSLGRGRWLLLCAQECSIEMPPGEAWALDASSRYAGFSLRGTQAGELLAAGCSLDFRLRAFPPGACAQSRIEQVPVILLREALDRLAVFVERPLAHYLVRWLEAAAPAHPAPAALAPPCAAVARRAGRGESR